MVNPLLIDLDTLKKSEIYVFYKGTTQKAEIIDFDVDFDLCLLDVPDSSKIPPALSYSPKPVNMGQHLHSVGFPLVANFGYYPKYLDGCVSSLLRSERGLTLSSSSYGLKHLFEQSNFYQHKDYPESYIMTSIPAIEGYSGAPLLAEDGTVVGIMVNATNGPMFIKAGLSVLHLSWAIPVKYLELLEQRAVASHGRKGPVLSLEDALEYLDHLDKFYVSPLEDLDHPEKFCVSPEDAVALVIIIPPNAPTKDKIKLKETFARLANAFTPPHNTIEE